MFDLLRHCPLLRRQIADGRVGFGINHRMVDFAQNRQKSLDLVVCKRTATSTRPSVMFRSLREMVKPLTIVLDANERRTLGELPDVPLSGVSNALVALEAKACMTEFGKARPRLFDELNSSHQTIHGDSAHAIAAGLAIINTADTFISPDRNKWSLETNAPVVNEHNQPAAAESAREKVLQLPRRSDTSGNGFDALGMLFVECRNDGSSVRLVTDPPAPATSALEHYDRFIDRLATLYATRFASI